MKINFINRLNRGLVKLGKSITRGKKHFIPYEFATSQPHLMLITLINNYPQPVSTHSFRMPDFGIEHPTEVKRVLSKDRGINIETLYSEIQNRYKRTIRVHFYVLENAEAYQAALELNDKFIERAKNGSN